MKSPSVVSYSSIVKICFLAKFIVLGCITVIHSQDYKRQYKFEQLHVGNGLSHNYTMDIVQDQQGFIWIGTLYGLQRYDGQSFTSFFNEPNDSSTIAGNSIDYLEINGNGQLLVGILDNEDLDRFDFKTETFLHNVDGHRLNSWTAQTWSNPNRQEKDSIAREELISYPSNILFDDLTFYGVFEDSNGSKWRATNVGLYKANKEGKLERWWHFCDEDRKDKAKTFRVNQILEDTNKKLWIATDKGLYSLSRKNRCLIPFSLTNNDDIPFKNDDITKISFDNKGQLWTFSSRQEIHIVDLKTSEIESFHSTTNKADRNILNITEVFFDQAGNVWLLTGLNGVYVLHSRTHQFEWYLNKNSEVNNTTSSLWTVFEDSNQNLWYLGDQVKTDDLSVSQELLGQIGPCYDMEESSDGIYWFCTTGSGIKRLDSKKGTIQHLSRASSPLPSGAVTAKYLDRSGNLWVGFWGGAAAHIMTNDFNNPTIYSCIGNESESQMGCFIQCILESKDGLVYFGSAEAGLSVFNPKENSWKSFGPNDNKPNALKHKYVRCIVEDNEGMIWLGTYGGGLYRYNPQSEGFKHFGRNSGLPDEVIEELMIDKNGFVWILTTKRLTRLDPKTEMFETFDGDDGMPDTQFHRMSHASRSSGKMHISTDQGYVSFHPDSILTDLNAPNTAIVKMTRYRNGVNGVEAIEESGINQKRSIELSYLDFIVRFEFSAIKFHKATKSTIEYKLDGFQKDWISLEESRQASFTSLPAGKYTLMVRSTNANGVTDETPASLILNVSPPWWKTWWAFLLYALSFTALLLYFWKKESRRLRLQNQLEKEQLKANQLHELDQTKTRFFSNISHEFRTPLTVILGMTEEIEEPKGVKSIIQQSSQNLLRLINQMLDISKMDAGKLKLQLHTGDIVEYIKYISESFDSLASQKVVDFLFTSNVNSLKMKFDGDKIQHIVFNLLSNAIKYTPYGGQIKLEVNQSEIDSDLPISIIISDSGLGIPEEDQPFVFDRYFQAQNSKVKSELGTGIGLSFTKELVDLMRGKISVSSTLGSGSIFTVRLPYISPGLQNVNNLENSNLQQVSKDKHEVTKQIQTYPTNQEPKPSLLLIEDNPQVVRYIIMILENDYLIFTAENGDRGIKMAIELIPDIIISDVMMPLKDGYVVTNTLKNDERTSHIPIILLSAKASVESRLEGLERGADAYLTKPFLKKELILRLSKMIELRKNLQSRHKGFNPVPETEQEGVHLEDLFLTKIKTIIEDNLSESEFGVNELCQKVGLSQSQLFRKLKALTNKSTSAYLRGFRLHKAKGLLEKGDMNVTEVAFAVGFNDPLYFSRVFSKSFGCSPSDIS